jgi:hypothetical protein
MPQMAKLFCIYCGQLCIMFNNLQATTVETKALIMWTLLSQ